MSDENKGKEAMPIAKKRPPRLRRYALLALVPLAVAAGVFWWRSTLAVGSEDASVRAERVDLAPQVSGRVVAVRAADDGRVRKGQVLYRIDPKNYRTALASAKARLAAAKAAISASEETIGADERRLVADRETLAWQRRQTSREDRLGQSRMVSKSRVDAARHALNQALGRVRVDEADVARDRAALGGKASAPAKDHASVREAAQAVALARRRLARTVVRAPGDGWVAKLPNVGDTVSPRSPSLVFVYRRPLWVVADIKETELADVRPGESVSVSVDAFPGRRWKGRVASMGIATGDVFSVLPAQNATGNWIKVTRRLPVRIRLDKGQHLAGLRLGMSASVSIDATSGGGRGS